MDAVQHNAHLRRCSRYTKCTHSPDSVRCVVTAKTQYNLKNAEQYFEERLCVGDYYYSEGQWVSGEWMGAGAERLGLSGKVRADDFLKPYVIRNPNRRIRVLAETRQALEISRSFNKLTHSSELIILERLLNLRPAVHHEWAVPDHGFV